MGKNQALQVWQEERSKAISADCFIHGVCDEFLAAYPEFSTPHTLGADGKLIPDKAKAIETRTDDPAYDADDDVDGEGLQRIRGWKFVDA